MFTPRMPRAAASTALVAALLATVAPASAQEGFGADIPLSQAAQRIVQDGRRVEFGPGVDADALVSWKGSGWRQSIASAARSGGYQAIVEDGVVRIVKPGARAEVRSETTTERTEERIVRDRPAPSRRAPSRRVRVVEEETEETVERREVRRRPSRPAPEQAGVSGGGFVMVPVRAKAASADVEGGSSGWKTYGRPEKAVAAAETGWIAPGNADLRSVLHEWSARAGWNLVWKSDYQYSLSAGARFGGGFVEAVSELTRSMETVRPSLTVQFYQGNKVLVVANKSSDEVN